jgi:cytochrome oxidase Cu insertion factor (SCO1/SenC/PrrC family)
LALAVTATVVLVAVFVLFQRGQRGAADNPNAQGTVSAGRVAPSFELPSTKGSISLESFKGKSNVLLYWYEHAG